MVRICFMKHFTLFSCEHFHIAYTGTFSYCIQTILGQTQAHTLSSPLIFVMDSFLKTIHIFLPKCNETVVKYIFYRVKKPEKKALIPDFKKNISGI